MKNLMILFVGLILFSGCKEVQPPSTYDPTDPTIAPRVLAVWVDNQRLCRCWPFIDKENIMNSDTFPYGYYPNIIMVRFSKIMKSYTVIPNTFLFPEEAGYAIINYWSANTEDGQTFQFPVYGYFKVGKTYTVEIDKKATDITNLSLKETYQQSIIPEPVLRIYYSYPKDGDTNVYSPPYVYFFLNSIVDTNSLKSSVQISPEISGYWWFEPRNAFYNITSVLMKNTWYEFNFSTALKDTFNNYLPKPVKIRFKTSTN